MATRTIDDEKDRLTTILIAPLMTCSARLPVYTLIIGALIPNARVRPGVGLQGLVLFGALRRSGVVGALRRRAGAAPHGDQGRVVGLHDGDAQISDAARCATSRSGCGARARSSSSAPARSSPSTTIVLWALLSFPQAPRGQRQCRRSIIRSPGASPTGSSSCVRPIGFNRDIALALIPAMAAREVAVAALGTVYAIDDAGRRCRRPSDASRKLQGALDPADRARLPDWFVFAPQCISTIAVTRRETNGWKWPAFMVGYLFALAYIAARDSHTGSRSALGL